MIPNEKIFDGWWKVFLEDNMFPETLDANFKRVETQYKNIDLIKNLGWGNALLKDYVGRENPFIFCKKYKWRDWCKSLFKREDLNHTGDRQK